jgi:dienelactone hydrolase
MHDVDAAVRAARADGAHAVVTVGLSMGGGAVLRQAALGRHRPDAAVSVSAVSRWYVRDTRPVQRVHWLLETTGGSAPGWCNCGSTSRG